MFLDTETKGVDESDRVFKVAYIYNGKEYNESFTPPVPISIDAMVVTGVTNKMIEGKPVFEGSEMQTHLKGLLEQENKILVAHNAKFDIAMLAKDEVSTARYIDTLKIAQYLDPDGVIPKYNMQYLRYFLELEVDDAAAHDALGDIRVLKALFERLYEKMKKQDMSHDEILDKMQEVSKLPVLIKKFNFGKYIGQKVADVAKTDRGYLEWLLGQKKKQRDEGQPDEDWEYTLETYVG